MLEQLIALSPPIEVPTYPLQANESSNPESRTTSSLSPLKSNVHQNVAAYLHHYPYKHIMKVTDNGVTMFVLCFHSKKFGPTLMKVPSGDDTGETAGDR